MENMKFYSFDLDHDPMTLILKLDPDMVKMYLHTENKVRSWGSSNVIAWTDRQTRRQTQTDTLRQTDSNEIITYPYRRMVIKITTLQHCGIATSKLLPHLLHYSDLCASLSAIWRKKIADYIIQAAEGELKHDFSHFVFFMCYFLTNRNWKMQR